MTRSVMAYEIFYGRWSCTDSLHRYIEAPLEVRLLDAPDMFTPPAEPDTSSQMKCAAALGLFTTHIKR